MFVEYAHTRALKHARVYDHAASTDAAAICQKRALLYVKKSPESAMKQPYITHVRARKNTPKKRPTDTLAGCLPPAQVAYITRAWRKIEGGLDALEGDAAAWRSAPQGPAEPPQQPQRLVDIAQIRAACTLDFIGNRPGPALLAARAAAAAASGLRDVDAGSVVEEGDGEEWSWRTGRGELSAWYDEVRTLPMFAARLLDAAALSNASKRLYSSRFGNEGFGNEGEPL